MIIGFPHTPPSKGGPGSFQKSFENELKNRGWQIVYPNDGIIPDFAFVLGGTRNLKWLFKLKRNNVPVLYRLGGINWLYKHKKTPWVSKLNIYLKLKLLFYVQLFFANGIVFQSNFAKEWLLKFKQATRNSNNIIIYNGTDIDLFKPRSHFELNNTSILCVEGNIDYSPYAIPLLNKLQEELIEKSDYKSLIVYGSFEDRKNREKLYSKIDFRGKICREDIHKIYKNATFLSLDINATCPNTVIEAMSSGLPIIGYDTGSLRELIKGKAGILSNYGSNPWNLNFPDVHALVEDAKKVLRNWDYYSENARSNSILNFNFERVVDKYISFLISISKKK